MTNKMYKLFFIIFSFIFLISSSAFADSCFIAEENGKVLQSEGDCTTSYGLQSTFKITLSLIGFNSGVLKDNNK